MDPDDILAKQVEQLEKEKRELQEKLKAQEKKVARVSYSVSIQSIYNFKCHLKSHLMTQLVNS